MREWLVIESSYKNAVFAPDDSKKPHGYIPRDVAERLLGRDLGGTVWFTKEESKRMRDHPDWLDIEPAGATVVEDRGGEPAGNNKGDEPRPRT